MMYNTRTSILWALALALAPAVLLVVGGCANAPLEGSQLPDDLLAEFPLGVGNTWIYSSTYYDIYQDRRITATYLITETIVDTQIYVPYRVSQVVRETVIVTSSISLDDLLPGCDGYYLNGTGDVETYWYIVSGTHIYRQSGELNLSDVESSWLEYVFPLTEDAHWYPDGEQREMFPDTSTGPVPGMRRVQGPIMKQVPAGKFESCFDVWTTYLSGGTESWFCMGVGLVGDQYAHQGTPFGHRTVLVGYRFQSR